MVGQRLCLLKRKRPAIHIIDEVTATHAHMLKQLTRYIIVVLVLAPGLAAAADESLYTLIDETHCKVVSQDEETGDVTRRCPGVADYKLLVIESDDRASITLITPAGREVPLDFWSVVTPTFSSLGPTVEWRTKRRNGKSDVVGLIVRVNTFNQSDVTRPQPYSVLVTVRVTSHHGCVTSIVPADHAASKAQARNALAAGRADCLPQISQQSEGHDK